MRCFGRAGLALLCALSMTGCFGWTHVGGGPTRTFANQSELTLTTQNVGQLRELLSVPTGQVLVSGDRVLVQGDGSVTAYDPAGAEVWSAPGGLAAIESDTVFLSEYAQDPQGCPPAGGCPVTSRSAIVARSLATGEEIPAAGERFPDDSRRGLFSESALGHRYRAWQIATRSWDPHGEVLYAPELRLTDVDTGAVHTFLPDDPSEFMSFQPLVDESTGRLYYRFRHCCGDSIREPVKGVDLATGNVLWSRDDLPPGDISVEGRRLYVGGYMGLRVLDSGTGATLWSTAETVEHGTFAVAGGTVYAETDGTLAAYKGCRVATCAPSWTAPISPDSAGYRIVVAGDAVYVASMAGDDTRVQVFPAGGCGQATCQPVADWLVGGGDGPGLVVVDARVYVRTATGVHVFGLPA